MENMDVKNNIIYLGGRMLKKERQDIPVVVFATTNEDISFTILDENVSIPAGTKIHVDLHNMIASHNQYHFEIELEDFEILYQN